MKTTTPEKKMAEWKSAFYSMNHPKTNDAKILAGLITNLSQEIRKTRSKQHEGVIA